MEIIDAQMHVWERDHTARPWVGVGHGGPVEATGDQAVAMLDEAGIDGAIIITTPSIYGFDPSYGLQVAADHPTRFAVVAPMDPASPDMDQAVDEWASLPTTTGLRLMLYDDPSADRFDAGGFDAYLSAAERTAQPMCVGGTRRFKQVAQAAERYDELQLVIDHLGMPAFRPERNEEPPFAHLSELLALARFPNVAVKVTGMPTLSYQEFPYEDIWSPIRQTIEAFGVDRVMWGSD